jgi:uncharacterized membrane-anchored protein YitT (DUF2179 family)
LNKKRYILEILGTISGAFIISIAISLFLLPNELSSGGFSGIATIFYYILKIPIGITILCINLPLFFFSIYKIGKGFLIKSIIGTISLSIFTDFFEKYGCITNDKMLAAIYGGVITGIGTAIIFNSNASTGGSDLLSIIVKRYVNRIEVGTIIVFIDGTIVLLNMIFLKDIEIGLYSVIAIYLMGVVITKSKEVLENKINKNKI